MATDVATWIRDSNISSVRDKGAPKFERNVICANRMKLLGRNVSVIYFVYVTCNSGSRIKVLIFGVVQ